MAKVITLYNHKGGVSKTTTNFNIGVFLAEKLGKRVLLVDADPQSNLTESFFASADDADKDSLPGTSIYDALRPRFEGSAIKVDVTTLELPQHSIYENLFILRGDWNFSLAERYFSNALTLAITESVHEKHTYNVFHNLFHDLIEYYGFDHILVDLGPSSGAITNLALLSCDGYFIPVTPDRFCAQAVDALARLIGVWIERHEKIISTFPPYGISSFPGEPVFLGAISQNFKAYAGRTRRPYQHWETEILEIVRSKIVGELPSRPGSENYVATIRDFGGLAPVAHIVGKAIFDLNREDTKFASAEGAAWQGVALESWLDRAGEYGAEIERIAEVIVNG